MSFKLPIIVSVKILKKFLILETAKLKELSILIDTIFKILFKFKYINKFSVIELPTLLNLFVKFL